MKVQVNFNLHDETDRHSYQAAISGEDLLCTLKDLRSWLRNQIKHADSSPLCTQTLEEVQGRLWEMAHDNDVEGLL